MIIYISTALILPPRLPPHSQTNDVNHVKKRYVMNPICGS